MELGTDTDANDFGGPLTETALHLPGGLTQNPGQTFMAPKWCILMAFVGQ